MKDYEVAFQNQGNTYNLPHSVDWRNSGIITSLMDEREYFPGYSWAFATVRSTN